MKKVLDMGIAGDEGGSGILVADKEGRPRIGLGLDEGIPSVVMVDENGNVDVGYLISGLNTDLELGAKGLGVKVDAEEALGMDTTTSVFKFKGFWRFTDNLKHKLGFEYSAYRRDGNRTILEDFTIEDGQGNQITIPAGSQVSSYFDLDIYKFSYNYSFFQDDRIDLSAGLGFYWMPISIGVNATGLIAVNEDESFNAPLPTIALRADFAITPKWFLRSSLEVFYLEIQNFKGSIYQSAVALEYLPWKHVGFGLAFDTFNLNIEADGEDYPEIDFKGELNFNITGLMLYMKMFF
jgi:hypothetical protein